MAKICAQMLVDFDPCSIEAEQSSRIEGTVATANEVFEAEAGAEFATAHPDDA